MTALFSTVYDALPPVLKLRVSREASDFEPVAVAMDAEGDAPTALADYNPATDTFMPRRSVTEVTQASMAPLPTSEQEMTLRPSVPFTGGEVDPGVAYAHFQKGLETPEWIPEFLKVYARSKVKAQNKYSEVVKDAMGGIPQPIALLEFDEAIVQVPGGFDAASGLPVFQKRPYVATTGAGKYQSPLILEKDDEAFHNVLVWQLPVDAAVAERAVFPAAIDLGANFESVVAAVVARDQDAHDKLVKNLGRKIRQRLYSTRAPSGESFKVFVRFDVGSAAGLAGFDAFAPHVVFDLDVQTTGAKRNKPDAPETVNDVGGGSVGEGAGGEGDGVDGGNEGGGGGGKKNKPDDSETVSGVGGGSVGEGGEGDGVDGGDGRRDGRGTKRKTPPPDTGTLNGASGVVDRLWQTYDVDGPQADAGGDVSVSMGAKLNPRTPRVAELIRERADLAHESRIYLSGIKGVEEVEFGDAAEPVGADDAWRARFEAAMQRSGFVRLQDKRDNNTPWHMMAYVSVVAKSAFDAGMRQLEARVAAPLDSETRRLRAVRDAFEFSEDAASVTAKRLLLPHEAAALRPSDADFKTNYVLPSLRAKGKVEDEIDMFAVGKPIWRYADSWVRELVAPFATGQEPLDGGRLASLLADEIVGFSERLDEAYIKLDRARRAFAYLSLCKQCEAEGLDVFGPGALLGEFLTTLLLREAAFAAEYLDRASTAAGALGEALQLHGILVESEMPSAADELEVWYHQRVDDVAGGDERAAARMKRQLSKTDFENRGGWSWLTDPTSGYRGKLEARANTSISNQSFAELDAALKKKLRNARGLEEQVAGSPLEPLEVLLREVGRGVLEAVIDQFDPVMFVSLCHPRRVLDQGKKAVEDLTVYGLDFDDDAFGPQDYVDPQKGGGAAVPVPPRSGSCDVEVVEVDTPATVSFADVPIIDDIVLLWIRNSKRTAVVRQRDCLATALQTAEASLLRNKQATKKLGKKGKTPKKADSFEAMGAAVLFKVEPLQPISAEQVFILELIRRMAFWMRKFPASSADNWNTQKFLPFVTAALEGLRLLDASTLTSGQKQELLKALYDTNQPSRDLKNDEGDFLYEVAADTPADDLTVGLSTKPSGKGTKLPLNGIMMIADVIGNIEKIDSVPLVRDALALFIDQERKELFLALYKHRELRHADRSVLFYFPSLGGSSSSSTAPPPTAPPPPAAVATTSCTRSDLLTRHNLVSELADAFVKRATAAGIVHDLKIAPGAVSTLRERSAVRRELFEQTRSYFNGLRVFNWAATHVEHMRMYLDHTDVLTGNIGTSGEKNTAALKQDVFTLGVEGFKIHESLLPEAPALERLKTEDLSKPDTAGFRRRDLRRWMWLSEFEAHDCNRALGQSIKVKDLVMDRPPDRAVHPSRRVAVHCSSSDSTKGFVLSTASVLAKTGTAKGNEFETTSFSVKLKDEKLPSPMEKFFPSHFLAFKGCNTHSDRLFLSNGFLTSDELLKVYDEMDASDKARWPATDEDRRAVAVDRNAMPLRMSTRARHRFGNLERAADVAKNIARRAAMNGDLQEEDRLWLAAIKSTGKGDASVTDAELKTFEHFRFYDSAKAEFFLEDETSATNLPVETRFLHFYDLYESADRCPYTFDDFAAHAVDVAERVEVFVPRVDTTKARPKPVRMGFKSCKETINQATQLLKRLKTLKDSVAMAKLAVKSTNGVFENVRVANAAAPANFQKTTWWWSLADPGGDSPRLDAGAVRSLETLDKILEEYDQLEELARKLRAEARFVEAVGRRLCDKASRGTCQRVVDERTLKTTYLGYNSELHAEYSAAAPSTSRELKEIATNVSGTKEVDDGALLSKSDGYANNGWGSMYTCGSSEQMHAALIARGSLHADGRHASVRIGLNGVRHWADMHDIVGVNPDFGLHRLCAHHLHEEIQKIDLEDEALDIARDSPDSLTGVPFYEIVSVNLLRDLRKTGRSHRLWRSTERLPTLAELLAQFLRTENDDCFDGLESRYTPASDAFGGVVTFWLDKLANVGADRVSMFDGRSVLRLRSEGDLLKIDDNGMDRLSAVSGLTRSQESEIARQLARFLRSITWGRGWATKIDKLRFPENSSIVTRNGRWADVLEDDKSSDDEGDGDVGGGGDGDEGRTYVDDPEVLRDADDSARGDGGSGSSSYYVPVNRENVRKAAEERAAAAAAEGPEDRKARTNRRFRAFLKKYDELSKAERRNQAEQEGGDGDAAMADQEDDVVECAESLPSTTMLLRTSNDGDCFYDAIYQLLKRRLGSVGPLLDNVAAMDEEDAWKAMRSFGAQFLRNEHQNPIWDSLTLSLANAIVGSPDTIREVLQSETGMQSEVEMALQASNDELAKGFAAMHYANYMSKLGNWATDYDVVVLSEVAQIRICLYQRAQEGAAFVRFLTTNNDKTDLPTFHVAWTNYSGRGAQNVANNAHFEGLVPFSAAPAAAPADAMDVGSSSGRSRLQARPTLPTQPTSKTLLEAVALAVGANAVKLQSNVAAWKRVSGAYKHLSELERLATKTGCDDHAIPFVTRRNLLVYKQRDTGGEEFALVATHAPFACAREIKVFELADDAGFFLA